jgi:hypothetical protein
MKSVQILLEKVKQWAIADPVAASKRSVKLRFTPLLSIRAIVISTT